MNFNNQFSFVINTSLDFNNKVKIIDNKLKTAFAANIIHINNNWSDAVDAGICTGSGIYNDPYIIKDLEIDGNGSGNCIFIENSNAYFRIENCTLYNSGHSGALKLDHTENGLLINNDCSDNNDNDGITLYYSKNITVLNNIINNNMNGILVRSGDDNAVINNTAINCNRGISLIYTLHNNISGNILNNNKRDGLYLLDSSFNNVDKNIANYNDEQGFHIDSSNYNEFGKNEAKENKWDAICISRSKFNNYSDNIMILCGLNIYGNIEELSTHIIRDTNLVNGKPVYYYVDQQSLFSNNFTNAGQIILINCSDCIITNLETSNGISLYYCENNSIINNKVSQNNNNGIHLEHSNNSIISENEIQDNNRGVELSHCFNNTISGNSIFNNIRDGIRIFGDNNEIIKNDVKSSENGILLSYSNNNTISSNNVTSNSENGILLTYSVNNTIFSNNASDNYFNGIELSESHSNLIKNNKADRNCYPISFIVPTGIKSNGLLIMGSNNNVIIENYLDDNGVAGIFLSGYNNSLENNIMKKSGLFVSNIYEVLTSNIINPSNIVNGKKLYYYKNEINLEPDDFNDAGQIILVNCNNSIILNLNLSYTSIGISLYYSDNNTISNSIVNFNKLQGISLYRSKNNIISENNISNNKGIDFDGISYIGDGILLSENSNYNLITHNIISNNYKTGIYIYNSFKNCIYYNTFVNNLFNAIDNAANNDWNWDYLGNYWDDYSGIDANDDGIGDTPYIISGTAGSQDNYPIWDDGPEPPPAPQPSGTFMLTSSADSPDSDGTFNLMWTSSEGADNYSIYQYNSLITEINGSLTLLMDQTASSPHTISGLSDGTYYYIILAVNEHGETLSNCIVIIIEIPSPPKSTPLAIPGYHGFYVLISILVISWILSYKVGKKLAKHGKKIQ